MEIAENRQESEIKRKKRKMRIGYARVSTTEQHLEPQLLALKQAGCDMIFKDLGVSGSADEREGLDKALRALGPEDVLVVWRLDRLGRSLIHLIELINLVAAKGAHFQSLNEAIDTDSPGGRFVFHMMGALAEFERSLISERTRAGMQVAKAAGRPIGRPPALSSEQIAEAQQTWESGDTTLEELAIRFRVHVRTMARALKSTDRQVSTSTTAKAATTKPLLSAQSRSSDPAGARGDEDST